MKNFLASYKGYIIAVVLGAIGGGLMVALATRAIPKIMSQVMAGIMQTMMHRMEKEGRNPMEMCRQMMVEFNETQNIET